jgi:pyruvate dehydrogenase E2 component (dihydrolipoamide acetyltransferase)
MMMPALSPTMKAGTIAKWLVSPGSAVTAGQAIAEIETDKATMTLESMDANIIGKLLVESGSEVYVGSPILVLLEEGADHKPFADFVVTTKATPAAAAAAPVAAKAAPAPAPAPAPVAKAAPAPAPAAAAAVVAAPAPAPGNVLLTTVGVRTMWAAAKSGPGPLTAKLAANQHAYIAKYGRGLHRPLPLPAVAKKQ